MSYNRDENFDYESLRPAFEAWQKQIGEILDRLAWIDSEIEGNEELRRDYQEEINQLWDTHDDLHNQSDSRWVHLISKA